MGRSRKKNDPKKKEAMAEDGYSKLKKPYSRKKTKVSLRNSVKKNGGDV